jgi:hypothetical protein
MGAKGSLLLRLSLAVCGEVIVGVDSGRTMFALGSEQQLDRSKYRVRSTVIANWRLVSETIRSFESSKPMG